MNHRPDVSAPTRPPLSRMIAAVVGSAILIGALVTAATPTGRRGVRTLLGAEAPPAPVQVLAVGDMSCDANRRARSGSRAGSSCTDRAISDEALALSPDVLLALGDTQYEDGSLEEYHRSYAATWGRLRHVTRPAVGNHEYLTPDASGYFDYFGSAAGPRDKGYYSFDVGGWHLVALNSECSNVGGCDEDSPQYRWLVDDLARHRTQCMLAYWHAPRFSSGKHGDDPRYEPFWRALADAGTELILSGHDHIYERFARLDAAGNPDGRKGIRQFVVGTGGRNHTRVGATRPHSEVLEDRSFGFLELRLHADSYDWRFRAMAPSPFKDSGSERCH